MPSPLNFKTASWKGIIRPDLDPPNELVALSVRLPKDLAEDVELAAYEFRRYFASTEEVIATAVAYAINSLAEDPPPTRIPKGTGKRRKPPSARRRHRTQ